MVHRPAETIEPDTETIAVRNARGFGLLESSGDDCIGAVTLSVDSYQDPQHFLHKTRHIGWALDYIGDY